MLRHHLQSACVLATGDDEAIVSVLPRTGFQDGFSRIPSCPPPRLRPRCTRHPASS